MNVLNVNIDNCMDCKNHYVDRILTADSFEHEEGVYCKLCPDTSYGKFGQNGRHRLVCSDDWNVRKYSQIPDWCPLLTRSNYGNY